MKTPSFRHTALVAALGLGATGMVTPLTAISAPVGNTATSADNRMALTLGTNLSRRDVEQDGSAAIVSVSETETSTTKSGGTRTVKYEESERVRGLEAEEEQTDLYAQLSVAVTPRIEVYGRLGATKSELKDFDSMEAGFRRSVTVTESDGTDISDSDQVYFSVPTDDLSSIDTDMGWMIGIGTKVNLYEWESHGIGLTFDALYQRRNTGGGDEFTAPYDFADSIEITDNNSEEWQAALILEKRTGNFRPYGGVRYSRVKSEYDLRANLSDDFKDDFRSTEATVDNTGTLKMESEQNIGVVGGLEYLLTPAMSLAGEVRAGDETAFNVAFRYRF